MIPLDLPTPVAAYFAADRSDGEAVASCFTEKAVVKDEGNTYVGHGEIEKWKSSSSSKYSYTSEPKAFDRIDENIIVRSHLVGNFPGSPVDLRFFFVLDGEKISSLEIVP